MAWNAIYSTTAPRMPCCSIAPWRNHWGPSGSCCRPEEGRYLLSFACLGLIAAVRQIARANAISHIVAVMERSLRRRLSILGLPMVEMGEPVSYHGIRVPSYSRLDLLEARLKRLRPDLFPVLTADVAKPWSVPQSRRIPACAA
jgi:N-acyl-L-homoserine lactone synthetase